MSIGKPEQCERMDHRKLNQNGNSHPTKPKTFYSANKEAKRQAKKKRRLMWKQYGEDAPHRVPHFGYVG